MKYKLILSMFQCIGYNSIYHDITTTIKNNDNGNLIVNNTLPQFDKYNNEVDDGFPDSGEIIFKDTDEKIIITSYKSKTETSLLTDYTGNVNEGELIQLLGDRGIYRYNNNELSFENLKSGEINTLKINSNIDGITGSSDGRLWIFQIGTPFSKIYFKSPPNKQWSNVISDNWSGPYCYDGSIERINYNEDHRALYIWEKSGKVQITRNNCSSFSESEYVMLFPESNILNNNGPITF